MAGREDVVLRRPHPLRALRHRAALIGCAVVLGGCAGYERSLGPVALLEAAFDPDGVRLTNRDDEPIYFSVVASNHVLSAAFGFTPCTSPDECSAIAPGTSHVVPFDAVLGLSGATKEIFIYYWLLRSTGEGEHEAVAVDVLVLRKPSSVPESRFSP